MTTRSLLLLKVILTIATSAVVRPASANAYDTVVFGDDRSEAEHDLRADGSDVSRGELQVAGAGDVGGKADSCVFYYQKLTGDGFIQARVAIAGKIDRLLKTGVMIRENLEPGAKCAFVYDSWWDQFGPGVVVRASAGADAQLKKVAVDRTRAVWVRAERKGGTVTLSFSPDGVSWQEAARQAVDLTPAIYVGLTTTSNKPKAHNTARFDHVTTSDAKSPWMKADIGQTELPGNAEIIGLGEPSRRLLPKEPVDYYGGELTLKMKVDPAKQNYCTVKIWGSEGNENRVALTVEGKEIGQRHGAGADMFLSGGGPVSTGAFWYRTTLIPKWLTEGKTSVEIKLRSTGSLYAYGRIWNYDTYQHKLQTPTRGLYRLYTHTDPKLDPVGERQGKTPDYSQAPVRKVDEVSALQRFKDDVNARLAKIQNNPNAKSPDVEFLANGYGVAWTNAYGKTETLAALIKTIDAACQKFNADNKLAGGEWGGAYGGHGVAISHIAAKAQSQLSESVDLGTGPKPRRQQWIAMLLASREYGRTNRKTIANQAIACDTNIYGANKGLQALKAQEAYPEDKARRYLREAAGLEPYTYSEKVDGSTAPLKGPPLTHRMVTSKGTTHEWNWCCHNCYGRMGPYIYEMYRVSGDIDLRDRAVQMERAHVNQVYPSVDGDGYRAMLNEGVICTRNVYHPGKPGYPYVNVAASLVDPGLLDGVRQQLMDGQFFNSWVHSESSVFLPDDLAKIKARLATLPARQMPTAPGQPDFAWADEQNAVLTIRRGDELHFITFARRSEIGLHGIADVHSLTPRFERVVQFAVEDLRCAGVTEFTTVGPEVQTPFTGTPPDKPVSAWAGQKLPKPPGRPGSPADFYGARFGDLVIGMNSSYDKPASFEPDGFTGGIDLVSGKRLTAPLTIPPQTTVVFHVSTVEP